MRATIFLEKDNFEMDTAQVSNPNHVVLTVRSGMDSVDIFVPEEDIEKFAAELFEKIVKAIDKIEKEKEFPPVGLA